MMGMRKLGLMAAAGVLASALLATGCTVHAGYYDPYYHRYYAPAVEDPYIVQWETETHRRHEDFRRRNEAERREYWQWRHQHVHDQGHDHDRDGHG